MGDAGEHSRVALLAPGVGPEGGDAVGDPAVVQRAARVTLVEWQKAKGECQYLVRVICGFLFVNLVCL